MSLFEGLRNGAREIKGTGAKTHGDCANTGIFADVSFKSGTLPTRTCPRTV